MPIVMPSVDAMFCVYAKQCIQFGSFRFHSNELSLKSNSRKLQLQVIYHGYFVSLNLKNP